jgi:hypothetical protein
MYNLPGAAAPAPRGKAAPAEAEIAENSSAPPAAPAASEERGKAPAAETQTAADAAEDFAAASVAEGLTSARTRADQDEDSVARLGTGTLAPSADILGGDEPGSGAEIAQKGSSEGEDVDKAVADERTLTREEEIEEALNCPCIDAMREGPCGNDFIAAYRCFLESDSEPKGMDCVPQFATMQSCMAEHPEEYNLDDDEDPMSLAPAEKRETAHSLAELAEQAENAASDETRKDETESDPLTAEEEVVTPHEVASVRVDTSTQLPPDAPAVRT